MSLAKAIYNNWLWHVKKGRNNCLCNNQHIDEFAFVHSALIPDTENDPKGGTFFSV
jgi:hypothetical protein